MWFGSVHVAGSQTDTFGEVAFLFKLDSIERSLLSQQKTAVTHNDSWNWKYNLRLPLKIHYRSLMKHGDRDGKLFTSNGDRASVKCNPLFLPLKGFYWNADRKRKESCYFQSNCSLKVRRNTNTHFHNTETFMQKKKNEKKKKKRKNPFLEFLFPWPPLPLWLRLPLVNFNQWLISMCITITHIAEEKAASSFLPMRNSLSWCWL